MLKIGRIQVAMGLLLGLAAGQMANAAITVSSSTVGGGAAAGLTYINFDNLTVGGGGGVSGPVTVSFTGNGNVVSGAAGGVYAPPFLSGDNGDFFGPGGSDQALGADATPYLTAGTSSAILTFATKHTYIGLLWGSIDDYNTLEFYDGATLVGSVTGTQVGPPSQGSQAADGTKWVDLTSDTPFNKVVAKSTQFAFEFDNVAVVPEPSTYVAGALLLIPLLAQARRLRRKS